MAIGSCQEIVKMKKKKQLSLAQALGDLGGIKIEKLLGRNVFFKRKINGSNQQKHGTIIGLSDTSGRVLVKTDSGIYSRGLRGLYELTDPGSEITQHKGTAGFRRLCKRRNRARPGTMKKKKQLSLAQALGDLSKIDPDELLGRKVVFECSCNNIHGTPIKKKKTVHGNIKEWAKTPGFVIIEDESGGLYSRDLSNVWGDVLE